MIAIPAVDLREGACVQLVGGNYDQERLRLSDPVAVARQWAEFGFRRLHVVDLDAATGRGSNHSIVEALLKDASLRIAVGGGVRSDAQIDRLLDAGAQWVVLGTRAAEAPDWLETNAQRYPNRLIVAADVRNRNVVTHGWQRTLSLDVVKWMTDLNELPLGGVLVTAVHKEGQLQGTDLPLMAEVRAAAKAPVLASGGISALADLRALSAQGIAGAVLGMALYTGALDAAAVAKEFSS